MKVFYVDPYLQTVTEHNFEGTTGADLSQLTGYEHLSYLRLADVVHPIEGVDLTGNVIAFEDGAMNKCNQLFKIGDAVGFGRVAITGGDGEIEDERPEFRETDLTLELVCSLISWLE